MADSPMPVSANCDVSRSMMQACKVSRFNAWATTPDGGLVVYNTRSGKIWHPGCP
jgi:hypothetical protein